MESQLMAVDCTGRHARSSRYIKGSASDFGNERKTNNHRWRVYLVYAVLCACCTRWMLYLVYAVLGVCCTWCMLYLVYAVFDVYYTWCMLYSVYAVLSECCTQCMRYSVYTVLGVCYTQCTPYLASAVLGVQYTRFQLMIITCGNWERWHKIVFSDDGWIVDKEASDGGSRWAQWGEYEWTWGIRHTTWRIRLRRHGIGNITWWIRLCICCIRDGNTTRTRYSVKFQTVMIISPISCHFTVPHPHHYRHLRLQSYVIALYLSIEISGVHTAYSKHPGMNTLSTVHTTYCISLRFTVFLSQPVWHRSAKHVVLNYPHSQYYELTTE